jgi:hypothetical protein
MTRHKCQCGFSKHHYVNDPLAAICFDNKSMVYRLDIKNTRHGDRHTQRYLHSFICHWGTNLSRCGKRIPKKGLVRRGALTGYSRLIGPIASSLGIGRIERASHFWTGRVMNVGQSDNLRASVPGSYDLADEWRVRKLLHTIIGQDNRESTKISFNVYVK